MAGPRTPGKCPPVWPYFSSGSRRFLTVGHRMAVKNFGEPSPPGGPAPPGRDSPIRRGPAVGLALQPVPNPHAGVGFIPKAGDHVQVGMGNGLAAHLAAVPAQIEAGSTCPAAWGSSRQKGQPDAMETTPLLSSSSLQARHGRCTIGMDAESRKGAGEPTPGVNLVCCFAASAGDAVGE
jgi:hypothetical protein